MTESKKRPIIFSAPMILALLAGTKTVTRRVLKPQPPEHYWQGLAGHRHDVRLVKTGSGHHLRCSHWLRDREDGVTWVRQPFGPAGTRLWVRETWAPTHQGFSAPPYVYRADGSDRPPAFKRWVPSVHMPRDASRLTLEVVSVRVERLQDITEEDAKAEGVTLDAGTHIEASMTPYRVGFYKLWESINGAGSWEANPWVWRVQFRRLQAAIADADKASAP